MSNVLFLSDLHLDHQSICNFRTQFSSVKEHNECIKENYHKIVKPKDTVWFLGDVAFSKESLQDLKTWPGIKHIVLGNHDGSSESKKRGYNIKDMLEVYSSVHGFTRQYGFWLSHCPIREEELRGRYCIYGHTHSELIKDDHYLSVCMEHIDYTPISLEQIRTEFKSRGL